MHHNRDAGDAGVDFLDDIEMEPLFALEFVSAVAGADRRRQRVAPCSRDEFFGLFGIRQAGVAFLDNHILLDAAKLTEFRLNTDAPRVRAVDDALCNFHILLERMMRGIDHDRTVEAGLDAIVAGFFIAMIKVHRKNRLRKNLGCRPDDRFQHAFVGVFAGALRDLDDKRRLAVDAAAEQSHCLFTIVDVVGTYGETLVGDFVKLSGGNNHNPGSVFTWCRLAASGFASPHFVRDQYLVVAFHSANLFPAMKSLFQWPVLHVLVLALVVPGVARTQSPDDDGEGQRRLPSHLWVAQTPGGEYAVNLSAITSVSVHEYVVDGIAKVVELTVDTTGSTVARFYALQPVAAAPGGVGQGLVDTVANRINDLRQRLDSAGITNAVVKNYPTTTHAHTVEYRLTTRESVEKLYEHLLKAWSRMSGSRVKTE